MVKNGKTGKNTKKKYEQILTKIDKIIIKNN